MKTEQRLVVLTKMYTESCSKYLECYDSGIDRPLLLQLAVHVIDLSVKINDERDKEKELNLKIKQ